MKSLSQILEFFYGWATAGEIAYFAYIYVKVDKKDYPKVTGYTRAALLFGRFLSYVVSAPLILTGWSSYQVKSTGCRVEMQTADFELHFLCESVYCSRLRLGFALDSLEKGF